MAIVGLGLDVCSIDRMRRAIERHGDRFVNRICSPRERADAGQRDLATFVASRFAVKEAFAKALDGAPGVGWHEVEVKKAKSGKPSLELHGNAIAATAPYRNQRSGFSDNTPTYVFYDAVPLLPGKTLASVTLPRVSRLHVVSMAVGVPATAGQ